MFGNIKLFKFQGVQITLDPLFFLLFLFLDLSYVVILFIAVLVHEMAHSWMAIRKGWESKKINIGLFFGTAEVDLDMIPERDSIPIVAAGPLSNLILSVIGLFFFDFLPYDFRIYCGEFILINFALFLFNILPIYPLDGGRIFRDTLYLKLRDRRKSVTISATVSLILSVLIATYTIVTFNLILLFFSLIFAYSAAKDLRLIK